MPEEKGSQAENPVLDTRVRILSAARREFVERGYTGARMQSIADAAQANKAMIYYYFNSKRELYKRVVGDVLETVMGTLSGIIREEMSPEKKLEKVVKFYTDFYAANPDFIRLMIREFADRGARMEELMEQFERAARDIHLYSGLTGLIAEGIEKGVFRKVDPRQTVMSMISMCIGYFVLQPLASRLLCLGNPGEERKFLLERREQIYSLLLKGIVSQVNNKPGDKADEYSA